MRSPRSSSGSDAAQGTSPATAARRSLVRGLRLNKAEDAEAGYELMKTLYDRRIYPNLDGLRNVINLLGRTNEQIRRLKVEDIVDERIARKLEKEGLF